MAIANRSMDPSPQTKHRAAPFRETVTSGRFAAKTTIQSGSRTDESGAEAGAARGASTGRTQSSISPNWEMECAKGASFSG